MNRHGTSGGIFGIAQGGRKLTTHCTATRCAELPATWCYVTNHSANCIAKQLSVTLSWYQCKGTFNGLLIFCWVI